MSSAAVVATALRLASSAQDYVAEPGEPAVAFPKPDRPVADIVSPVWHDEEECDDAGEPRQLVRLLGIRSGMIVAALEGGDLTLLKSSGVPAEDVLALARTVIEARIARPQLEMD